MAQRLSEINELPATFDANTPGQDRMQDLIASPAEDDMDLDPAAAGELSDLLCSASRSRPPLLSPLSPSVFSPPAATSRSTSAVSRASTRGRARGPNVSRGGRRSAGGSSRLTGSSTFGRSSQGPHQFVPPGADPTDYEIGAICLSRDPASETLEKLERMTGRLGLVSRGGVPDDDVDEAAMSPPTFGSARPTGT